MGKHFKGTCNTTMTRIFFWKIQTNYKLCPSVHFYFCERKVAAVLLELSEVTSVCLKLLVYAELQALSKLLAYEALSYYCISV